MNIKELGTRSWISKVSGAASKEAATMGSVFVAGFEAADGRLITAAAWGIVGAYWSISGRLDSERTLRNASELGKWSSWTAQGEGKRLGRSEVFSTMADLSTVQFDPKDPIYTPLDGSAPINTPIELTGTHRGRSSGIES